MKDGKKINTKKRKILFIGLKEIKVSGPVILFAFLNGSMILSQSIKAISHPKMSEAIPIAIRIKPSGLDLLACFFFVPIFC